MPAITLRPDSRQQLSDWLDADAWVVACLCAAWCDTCRAYRHGFDAMADAHPDKRFVWIDIEDEAEVVGELDIENFPTLLIQRRDAVAFYGTVLPDHLLAERLLQAQTGRSEADLERLASSPSPENLRLRLAAANQEAGRGD
jgi:thiol-disulfide isomerase/thioredoxin